ncbi:Rad30 [Kluyveromyces lactis]|nr:Rad30 [Kluyveromyces lactis]
MSKYRWRNLIDLNDKEKSFLSPLACIAHIDVNAFFAQVEQVRCGFSRDDPVVAVQWTSILAVSYAARKYNVSRMESILDAIKKCDKIIPIHTAVFRKGEDYWQYHDGCGSWVEDESKKLSPTNYKVALEPYRRESRKLIKLFQDEYDLVEKASVDEAFIELGRKLFYALLMDDSYTDFAEIRDIFQDGRYNLDDHLPSLPTKLSIQFSGEVFNSQNRPLFEDWDDVLMCLASISTNTIRNQIDDLLGYTTSCGISMTKNLSKLASNYKKPNAQTIVKNSCIDDFLDCGKFEINSFWTLGGIRGKELIDLMELPEVHSIKFIRESWPVSSDDIRKFMLNKIICRDIQRSAEYNINEADVANISAKIYQLVRGQFRLPIEPRPLPKSMMSKKNLRNDDCASVIDCIEWLEVFCSELNYRVHDLEQEYEKVIMPRTIVIVIKGKAGMKYTQTRRITTASSSITSRELFINATKLINEIDKQHGKVAGVYPLRELSLTLSNFDIIDKGKTVLDMFGNRAISKSSSTDNNVVKIEGEDIHSDSKVGPLNTSVSGTLEEEPPSASSPPTMDENLTCKQCGETLHDKKLFQEHVDYHLSVQLSEQINGVSESSTMLTHAERILLFGKKAKKNAASVQKPKKKDGGIMKFFKK